MNAYSAAKASAKNSTSAVAADAVNREIAVRCRIAYPEIVTPNSDTGKFQAVLILEDEAAKQVEALVGDVAEATFGARELKGRLLNPIRSGDEPNRSGDGLAFRDAAFRGKTVVRAKSGFPPKCFQGRDREPITPDMIRGGDHCIVAVKAYGYNNQSAGVGISLGAIWFVKKGETTIERGGSGGSSFGNIDTNGIDFQDTHSGLV
jgi:hypothetical protein